MEILKEISSLRACLKEIRLQSKSIGLVPTMGALHEGHLSLIKIAKEENDFVACSIFVNPTQFNNKEDFDLYPSSLEDDIDLLKNAGCDLVFTPNTTEIYNDESLIKFSFGYLETIMEGAHRPGHFSGVAQIVSKLFNYFQPDRAYFGEKDLQQFCIIRQLVQDLSFPIEVKSCPIIREENGLAMSSRNRRLSEEERNKASILNQTLLEFSSVADEKSSIDDLQNQYIQKLNLEGFECEYIELVNFDNLKKPTELKKGQKYAICLAATLGKVRLIDNRSFVL